MSEGLRTDDALPAPRAAILRTHVRRTVQLAGPVVVARAGLLILVAVDTMMTGRAGADQLAYLGLGIAPQVALLLIGIGLLQGTAVMVAQADGARDWALCGAVWRVGVLHALALGLLFGALCLGGEAFLLAIGQEPELAAGGGAVLAMFSWSMPPMLVAIATAGFLEAISRPKPAMLVMLAANLLNAGLNWIFIYGHLGAPAMGAEGAVLATSIVRWLIMLALLAYVLRMPDGARYGVRGRVRAPWALGRRLRRLGYPIGLAQSVETLAFMTVMMFAGYLGTVALGAYQIAINVISIVFMCAIGLATATAVRVGNAVGRQDRPGIAYAGWTGVALVLLVTGAVAVLLRSRPLPVAAIYTADVEVLAAGAAALATGSLFLVFDGSQGVLMGALRGMGDVLVPLLIQTIAFWMLAVPGAWILAVEMQHGPAGLMSGLFVGVVASSVLLAARFAVVSRRPPRSMVAF